MLTRKDYSDPDSYVGEDMLVLTVYEPEQQGRDTGLLDSNGNKIFRQQQPKRCFGFDLRGGRA